VQLAKWVAPLAYPAAIRVLVDADVIVTRPLTPLLDAAGQGAVAAFLDNQPHRFESGWREATGASIVRRLGYVNAGVLALPATLGDELLERVRDVQARLEPTLRHQANGHAFQFPDQDAWNAVFSAVLTEDRFVALPHALAPFEPWEPVRLVNARTLRCEVEGGAVPYILHHIGRKPWLEQLPWPSAYGSLLPRVLRGRDVALRLERSLVPPWLRRGPAAAVRRFVGMRRAQRTHWHVANGASV
jgi:hypothetical protein